MCGLYGRDFFCIVMQQISALVPLNFTPLYPGLRQACSVRAHGLDASLTYARSAIAAFNTIYEKICSYIVNRYNYMQNASK